MHYQNGREAKNGDKVVQFNSQTGEVDSVGILVDAYATSGDYCNGSIIIAPAGITQALKVGACLVDCLHVEDVEKHPRPAGK